MRLIVKEDAAEEWGDDRKLPAEGAFSHSYGF